MKLRMTVLAALLVPALTAMAGVGTWGSGATFTYNAQVNISGSTLFNAFFSAPASTNDYIDADGNGIAGWDPGRVPMVQQLAPSPGASSAFWLVQYRGVGSGNGLAELDRWYNTTPVTTNSAWTSPDPAKANGGVFYSAAGAGPQYVPANDGTGNPHTFYGSPAVPTNIDIAVSDVPCRWLLQGAISVGNANWNAAPLTAGYGQNPVTSSLGAQSNKLKTLTQTNVNATPNSATLVDTPIAWVPICYVANRGTGLQNVDQSQLQHLYVTGRMPTGEHLIATTRDPGSGTRNGAMNCIGVDPSWGKGENLQAKNDTSANDALGASHALSNMGSSGRLQACVMNTRLAVGYVGVNGSSGADADALAGKYEVLNVKMDQKGGTQYVRPTRSTILYNDDVNTGWQIGGNETFITVGDPEAPVGGNQMANAQAANYIKNITHSIADFVDQPDNPNDTNMPGQYMAKTFFLTAGISSMPNPANPSQFVHQANLNTTLQTYMNAHNDMGIGQDTPAYGAANVAGLVPVSTGPAYVDAHGTVLVAGAALSKRNQIQDDFTYDHLRNNNDIPAMMAAVHSPSTFETAGTADGYVCVGVIGDNNGDGVFDSKDVRYFADGLAMDPTTGLLNRKAGFLAVDQNWTYTDQLTHPSGNYFNVTLANGHPYVAGDAIGDINNDGVIDGADMTRLQLVASGGLVPTGVIPGSGFMADGKLHWSNINEAVYSDLACDLNGDLCVGQDDVLALESIMGTLLMGDANGDGVVNFKDYIVLEGNFNKTGTGFAGGDFDGDGKVTFKDYIVLESNFNKTAGSVPEPASISMLILCVVPTLLRRRK